MSKKSEIVGEVAGAAAGETVGNENKDGDKDQLSEKLEKYQKEYACSIDEEQKRLKLKFGDISREWHIKQNMAKVDMRDILGSRSVNSSNSGKSDGNTASSRILRQSRKKGKNGAGSTQAGANKEVAKTRNEGPRT